MSHQDSLCPQCPNCAADLFRNAVGDLECSGCHCIPYHNTTEPVGGASVPEPPPKPGRATILPLVLDDLKARAIEGTKKYGTLLESHNGRDALMDAYQESLDMCMYLRQAIEERKL